MLGMGGMSARHSASKALLAIFSVGLSKETSIVFVIVVPSCWTSEIFWRVTACADSGSLSTMEFFPRLHLLDFVEFIVAGIQECRD